MAEVAKVGKFSVPLDDTSYNTLSSANQQLVSAALANFDCSSGQTEKDVAASYFIACAKGSDYGITTANVAFLLGPVIVASNQIESGSAIAPNAVEGQLDWTVQLNLKPSGQTRWADYTSKHNVNGAKTSPSVTQCSASGTPCADYVAFTLDGSVISAPVNESAINGGSTQINGSFTNRSANELANKLKFGALPVAMKTESVQYIK